MGSGLTAFVRHQWLAAIRARGGQPFLRMRNQPLDKGQRQIGTIACERHAIVAVAIEHLGKDRFPPDADNEFSRAVAFAGSRKDVDDEKKRHEQDG